MSAKKATVSFHPLGCRWASESYACRSDHVWGLETNSWQARCEHARRLDGQARADRPSCRAPTDPHVRTTLEKMRRFQTKHVLTRDHQTGTGLTFRRTSRATFCSRMRSTPQRRLSAIGTSNSQTMSRPSARKSTARCLTSTSRRNRSRRVFSPFFLPELCPRRGHTLT